MGQPQWIPSNLHKMEKYQEAGGTSSSSKTSEGNTDRLLPRCVHRKRKRRSDEKGETKKPKETGKEELDTLRHIVPSLRLDEGEVDTVGVIERTISYIQELHEKIAQRMAQHQEKTEDGETSVAFPSINLEQIQEAERLSQSDIAKEPDHSYLENLEELTHRNKTTSSLPSPSLDE